MPDRSVAVVTGASAGVGRATAVALARSGFDVALLARGATGLQAAATEVEVAGGRALVLETDVADWNQVDAAAERVEIELGEIDVWVNNAMTTVFAPVSNTDPAELKRATEVTYLGQVHGTVAALRRMRPRNRGRIVCVGSALAYVGIPLQAAYCGAKFATRGFVESVRAELFADGSAVTISMVHLPAVNTPQFDWCLNRLPSRPKPVPPTYQPEVAAKFVVQAAIDGRPSKLLGAWTKVVVAGSKLAPSVLSHYAARTGVASQQTDEPAAPGRPGNLWSAADEAEDHGARGSFGHQAGGALDPSFLKSLPETLADLLASAIDAARARAAR
jgi:short-subunit dehydrogenase